MPKQFRTICEHSNPTLSRSSFRASRVALAAAILAVGLVVGGCGEVVEDFVGACLNLDGPQFATAAVPGATVGQKYTTSVIVEIVRNFADNSYGYSFSVVGQLPPGLQLSYVKSGREIQIVGTPDTAGTYDFTLSVVVRDPTAQPSDPPSLCWNTADRSYQIVVAPGG